VEYVRSVSGRMLYMYQQAAGVERPDEIETYAERSDPFEALAVVRIVKPRIGMGIEFLAIGRRKAS